MTTNRAKEILVDSVSQLLNSNQYKAALSFRKNFQHPYSFRNLWLIFAQYPQASMVAGYQKWQHVGRQVRKGERSIAILAPIINKNEETKQEEIIGFRSVNVFDVSQTFGRDLPSGPQAQLVLGDSKAIQAAKTSLVKFAESIGLSVDFVNLKGGPCGYFSPKHSQIFVNRNLEPAHQLKTLIHEVAHAMLDHGKEQQPRHIWELEAESVAYIVCDSLGLDTSNYSFAYLAGWAESPDEIIPAAERACKLADVLLATLKPANEESADRNGTNIPLPIDRDQLIVA